jgi:hypothetical protein
METIKAIFDRIAHRIKYAWQKGWATQGYYATLVIIAFIGIVDEAYGIKAAFFSVLVYAINELLRDEAKDALRMQHYIDRLAKVEKQRAKETK